MQTQIVLCFTCDFVVFFKCGTPVGGLRVLDATVDGGFHRSELMREKKTTNEHDLRKYFYPC